jgi:DNA-binding NarL/FixJ family response regulator
VTAGAGSSVNRNREIAERLYVSENTVKTDSGRVVKKLP